MKTSKLLVTAFLLAMAIIVWQEYKNPQGPLAPLPRPSRFIGAGVIYGLLGLLNPFAPEFAGLMGLGMVIALATHPPGPPPDQVAGGGGGSGFTGRPEQRN